MARPHHGAPCHWLPLAVEKAGVEWDTPAPTHTGAALIHGKLLAGILEMAGLWQRAAPARLLDWTAHQQYMGAAHRP